MGDILGLGCTHYPGLLPPEEQLPALFHRLLTAPNVPAPYKDPRNWPAELVAELGNDGGLAAARRYGERMANGFRAVRKALDDFSPDIVLVWGDDQYENFRRTSSRRSACWATTNSRSDRGRPQTAASRTGGTSPATGCSIARLRDAAKYLATGLIEHGVDIAYAYQPLHHPFAHAFTNTFLYLDWDRQGFPYPVIPFAINCYGSNLLHAKGGTSALFMPPRDPSETPDPPSPQPWRCMDVGAAIAEIFAESPWRVALIASSSWSHCFLSPTNGYLWPDHKADRQLFDALAAADYKIWRQRSLRDMEAAGQHEMLNWMALVGAMEKLGRRPVVHDYVETHIFASEKCFVSFPP